MAEFKIGRLRFTWEGEWTPAKFYNRDSVVQYNGKMYVCLVPNTSNEDFYEDLYATTEGAPTPYWNVIIEGKTWKGDWTPTTKYSLGNLVKFGGEVYVCTIAHTSDTVSLNLANFDTYAQFANWNNSWNTNYAYGIGDVVKYGGIVYTCIANHISASTTNLGLEDDQSSWAVLSKGVEYKGDWSSGTRYKLNDIVKLNSGLYIATAGHSPSGAFNDSNWDDWVPGQKISNMWSSGTTYQPGEIIVYGGDAYVSNMVNNINNNPSTDTGAWSFLNNGYNLQGDWNSSTSYKVGDIVRKGGIVFEAVADNSNQEPSSANVTLTYEETGSSGTTLKVNDTSGVVFGMTAIGDGFGIGQTILSVDDSTTLTLDVAPDVELVDGQTIRFTGVNVNYWTILTPSIQWTDRWSSGTSYNAGDVVRWRNNTHFCVQSHVANNGTRPDVDATNVYWILYIPNARKNALTTYGDLETYGIIGNSAIAIGTDSFTLRATGDANGYNPTWAHINSLPNVYYVATTGIDTQAEGYGLTWDKPWKTIKYACDIVGEGPTLPNAAALLRDNKNWLTAEMYQWMLYQVSEENSPFNALSTFDQTKTIRDANYIIDALAYDITRGGNSQIVAATLAYFEIGSTTNFFNAEVTAQMPYFIAALTYLSELIDYAITNTAPPASYQTLNDVPTEDVVPQEFNYGDSAEASALAEIQSLFDITITALTAQDTVTVPAPNSGATASIMVKTGTYSETLPIVIPANVAVVGDELRGVVVQPAITVNTTVTATTASEIIDVEPVSTMTLLDTTGITVDTPVQFTGTMGGVTYSQTYYATLVAGNKITISETAGTLLVPSTPLVLTTSVNSSMLAYGGDAIKDMFYMRNASGLRNVTLRGLLGMLGEPDANTIRVPTGGAYTSLDPGTGPDDTSAWIFRRSPYVQNVSAFGYGCAALKIDGSLHNGGNKSMVANDYTHIIGDGIGVWCTGTDAVTEVISVFSYYGYAGYFAQGGGRIRAANGNSSYGTYGVIAEGYDITETPASGTVYNQSSQTQAQVQSAFGSTAELLKINYANAGAEYDISTTNLLAQSNQFDNAAWTSDGNLEFSKINIAPTGNIEAWTLRATSSTPGDGYVYQNLAVNPKGATYTGVSAVNISGSGINATFNITVTSTEYIVTVNAPGSGYVSLNQLFISGGQLGGRNTVNDCIITVTGLAGSGINAVSVTGTVPTGSNMSYTCSVYVQAGTSDTIDLYGIFSGSSTVSSSISYNVTTGVITPSSASGGFLPTKFGAEVTLADGWYRLWFALNDTVGLNDQLQFRIYPNGATPAVGDYTFCYGSQVEVSYTTWFDYSPSFYLETSDDYYAAYANFNITGAGTGAVAIGNEIRTRSVFQARVTDPGSGAGGSGYLTSSNNGQSGTTTFIQLSQSDNNTQANYTGMRLFINSGTGAGQYGYISAFNDSTKIAQILKESFDSIQIESTNSSGNVLTLGSSYTTDTLYEDQAVQFIPTYYTTSISSTSLAQATVTGTTGGLVNTLTVSSTLGMTVNMGVTFTGNVFSTINTGYIYFIYEIVDETTVKISDQLFGNVWPLNSATGTMTMNFTSNTSYLTASTTNMVVNYPIQFTGTSLGGLAVGSVYYINEVVDATHFSIANSLVEVVVTDTNPSNSGLTVTSTATLIALNPIIFSGAVIGGVVDGQKYYISKIIDSETFSISESLIIRPVTQTAVTSNLITTSSTTGLVVNNPVQFVGTAFGNIVSETTYYVLAINNDTTFTISQTPGGGAVALETAEGLLTMRTAPAAFAVTSDTGGAMDGATTSSKLTLSLAIGSMNGTFSTSLFGGITLGTTYFITSIDSLNNQVVISDTLGGSPLSLVTKTGSMNLAAVGWDHINPGTPIATSLDNSSVYFIEPRTTFSEPAFTQEASVPVTLAVGTSWVSIAHGDHYWMALPSGNSTAAGSIDGDTWTAITLPSVQSWKSIAYGSGYWVAVSSGGSGNSKAIYSNSNGLGWRTVNLPSATTWAKVVFGNGRFVAVAVDGSSAISANYGASWTAGSSVGITSITGLAYGAGKFMTVSSAGTAAYSIDGNTWVSSNPVTASAWADITYGNGRFVAVSSTSANAAYSFDGLAWYESNTPLVANKIAYGQGIFLALANTGTVAYTSEGGLTWKKRTVTNDGYGAVCFGITSATDEVVGRPGSFATLAGRSTGSMISAGVRTKARAIITSSVITALSEWEPGSGYTSVPTVTFTDPNITSLATVTPRISSGTLASPTFFNRGVGYNTNSTSVKINGNGYADVYQTGFTMVLNNLTRLPQPGDNLTFAGIDQIYKVTSAVAVYGTEAPTLEANVEISPDMSIALSPENGTAVSIRTKYSQARLSNHDFLNIGYGNFEVANYPGYPEAGYGALSQNQVLEVNFGRVFYTSTDQDGNFKVGNLFGVQQATGIVTLSATQFGLTGLSTLSLGGIAVGGSSVVIQQFSTDGTFIANSDTIVPTQRAVKAYLSNRLSQGGSNTFTGQLIAGTILVGGPDRISSTVPNGSTGSVIKMPTQVIFNGPGGAVDGGMAALDYFVRGFTRRGNF